MYCTDGTKPKQGPAQSSSWMDFSYSICLDIHWLIHWRRLGKKRFSAWLVLIADQPISVRYPTVLVKFPLMYHATVGVTHTAMYTTHHWHCNSSLWVKRAQSSQFVIPVRPKEVAEEQLGKRSHQQKLIRHFKHHHPWINLKTLAKANQVRLMPHQLPHLSICPLQRS